MDSSFLIDSGGEDDPGDELGEGDGGRGLGGGDVEAGLVVTELGGGGIDEADLVVTGVGVDTILLSSSMDWLTNGMIFLR